VQEAFVRACLGAGRYCDCCRFRRDCPRCCPEDCLHGECVGSYRSCCCYRGCRCARQVVQRVAVELRRREEARLVMYEALGEAHARLFCAALRERRGVVSTV